MAKTNRVLPRELVIANTLFNNIREDSASEHQQMDNTFPAKDGEALYSQPNQDWELTVAQIMSYSLQNSDFI